jgi:threonine/homoserine/homoserine lactone efflux protein
VGQVVGALLPLAFVVAVSPVPILAIILVLLTPRADVTSAGFMVGWIAGIVGVTTVSSLLAGTSSPSSTAASWVQVVLGVLLLAFAVRQWRSRPRHGVAPEVPTWLAAIDRLTAVRAGGLGLVLSAANPKIMLVCVAAGLTIAGGGLSAAQGVWSVLLFTITAASTVAVPVLAYAVGRERMTGPLELLRSWLTGSQQGRDGHAATADRRRPDRPGTEGVK